MVVVVVETVVRVFIMVVHCGNGGHCHSSGDEDHGSGGNGGYCSHGGNDGDGLV